MLTIKLTNTKEVPKMGTAKTGVVTVQQLKNLVNGLCAKMVKAGLPATVSTNPTRVGILVAGHKPQKLVLGINFPKTSGLIATSSPYFTAANTKNLVAVKKGGFNARGQNPYKGYAIASGHFTLAGITKTATTVLAPLFKSAK